MIIFKILLLLYFLIMIIASVFIRYNIFKAQDMFISGLIQQDLEDLFRYKIPTFSMHLYIILTIITLLALLC